MEKMNDGFWCTAPSSTSVAPSGLSEKKRKERKKKSFWWEKILSKGGEKGLWSRNPTTLIAKERQT